MYYHGPIHTIFVGTGLLAERRRCPYVSHLWYICLWYYVVRGLERDLLGDRRNAIAVEYVISVQKQPLRYVIISRKTL